MDRRAFITGTTVGLATALAGCASHEQVKSAPFVLGMTDITVRKELQADFPGTIATLQRLGYTHFGCRLRSWTPFEPPDPPPAEKAKILRDAGLRIGAVRLTPRMARVVPVADEIADAKSLGAQVVVMTAAPIFFEGAKRRTPSLAELNALIHELDDIGAQVKAAGMKFAWHNHDADAVPVDGVRALDRIIEGTDPNKVFFELDLAWAYIGGYDPVGLAQRMGKRLVSLHVKDVSAKRGSGNDRFVPPGDGDMNYGALFPRIRQITNALPAVEVDAPPNGLEAAARAIAFIKTTVHA